MAFSRTVFARTRPQRRLTKKTSPRSCSPTSSAFAYAFISEHHGEPVYIDKVDTLPVPELLMCKAAALTKQIRMGAAVKLIHLAHPVDTAIQAAVTDHVVGGGRFIFGFGSGFPNPLFAGERGLIARRPPRPHARVARSDS